MRADLLTYDRPLRRFAVTSHSLVSFELSTLYGRDAGLPLSATSCPPARTSPSPPVSEAELTGDPPRGTSSCLYTLGLVDPPRFRATACPRTNMRGGGLGLFMALAVLGPRASAQPNAPLSRTPASPIVVAQDAAKAYWGRSVRDHNPRVPQKRELTHELAVYSFYDCSASGSECQNRIYWVGSYSTKWYAEDACNNDPTCVAYDWSDTQSLGFMCSATTPRSDEYNEYVMCTAAAAAAASNAAAAAVPAGLRRR